MNAFRKTNEHMLSLLKNRECQITVGALVIIISTLWICIISLDFLLKLIGLSVTEHFFGMVLLLLVTIPIVVYVTTLYFNLFDWEDGKPK